jgi:phage terminase large subunit-like protein
MIKKGLYFLTALLVAFGMLAATTPAFAYGARHGTKESGRAELNGTITVVDTVGNTVTVASRKGGASIVLSVDSSTRIRRNGVSVTLAALQVGDKVEARYNSTTMLASSINARFKMSELQGTIAAVDSVGNTVTITPRKGGANVVLNVDSNTRIRRNGVATTLASLQVGDKVEAGYSSATMLASSISAEFELSEIQGTIAAVDTVANTVTITPQKGGANVVLNVDSTTRIKRNGVVATLAALQVGDKIEASYNPVSMLAGSISAELP